jgi:hypothetical protein
MVLEKADIHMKNNTSHHVGKSTSKGSKSKCKTQAYEIARRNIRKPLHNISMDSDLGHMTTNTWTQKHK